MRIKELSNNADVNDASLLRNTRLEKLQVFGRFPGIGIHEMAFLMVKHQSVSLVQYAAHWLFE